MKDEKELANEVETTYSSGYKNYKFKGLERGLTCVLQELEGNQNGGGRVGGGCVRDEVTKVILKHIMALVWIWSLDFI